MRVQTQRDMHTHKYMFLFTACLLFSFSFPQVSSLLISESLSHKQPTVHSRKFTTFLRTNQMLKFTLHQHEHFSAWPVLYLLFFLFISVSLSRFDSSTTSLKQGVLMWIFAMHNICIICLCGSVAGRKRGSMVLTSIIQAYPNLLQTITISQPAASRPLSQIITSLCAICPCSAGICVMPSNWTKRKYKSKWPVFTRHYFSKKNLLQWKHTNAY